MISDSYKENVRKNKDLYKGREKRRNNARNRNLRSLFIDIYEKQMILNHWNERALKAAMRHLWEAEGYHLLDYSEHMIEDLIYDVYYQMVR